MTVSQERPAGLIVFTCDDCDDTLETYTDDFREATVLRRAERWEAICGEAWHHYCPGCWGIRTMS